MEILAKQLVKVRNQKAQSLQASGHIQGLATQNTMMASNIRMAGAMEVSEFTLRTMVEQRRVFSDNGENHGENEQSHRSRTNGEGHTTIRSGTHEIGYYR